MPPKPFVKDVVKHLELVTPKSGRADAAGPSRSNTAIYSPPNTIIVLSPTKLQLLHIDVMEYTLQTSRLFQTYTNIMCMMVQNDVQTCQLFLQLQQCSYFVH